MRWRELSLVGAAVAALTLPVIGAGAAEDYKLPHLNWSFQGPLGTFDKASAQRGFQIYSQICSACHSMQYMAYRNLAGIGLSAAQIKAVAAAVQVPGGINDQGQPFERAGLPSDTFKAPFANEQAARAAMGGAYPPDQSVLELARDGGPDYIFGILTSYADPPKGFTLAAGKYYNMAFPGHQISMPPPLTDDAVQYSDGTKATLAQEAKDVATFLTFAANQHLDEQHQTGVRVLIFLAFLTVVTYIAKRRIWSDIH